MKMFDNLKGDKKNLIMTVALEEFATFGYSVASTNRIVKSIGISKGSLFKYFNSKLELYKYLVEYVTEDLLHFLSFSTISPNKWQLILLKYAEKEFDYLIEKPLHHAFFKRVVMDIDLQELNEISTYLTSKSNESYSKLYAALDLDKDISIHIMFILKGYNDYFFKLHDKKYSNALKEEYINGLLKHLELIKMEDNNESIC